MTTAEKTLLTQPCPHKDPDSDGYCHNCEGTMTVLTPLGSEVAALIRSIVEPYLEKHTEVREQQVASLGESLSGLRSDFEDFKASL